MPDRRTLAKILIICILAVPSTLLFVGLTAKLIGYRPASIREEEEYLFTSRVPIYDPLVEAAKFLFGFSFLIGVFSSIYIYLRYVKTPDRRE